MKRIIQILIIFVLTLCVLPLNIVKAAPADCYWVGDGGNWSDATNHWATSSGGAPGAGNLPDSTSNVHFDANSFTAGGQTVVVDALSACLDMDWTGATNDPTLGGAAELRIYGDSIFIYSMTFNRTGTTRFYGASDSTLTSNGISFTANTELRKSGGSLTLLDASEHNVFTLYQGTLNTNGESLTCNNLYSSGGSAHILNLGSSTVTINNDIYMTAALLTVNAGTSTIIVGNIFSGGGHTYHNIELVGVNNTIIGSNIINDLKLNSSGVQTITFTDGTTQTIEGEVYFTGDPGQVNILKGSGISGWNLIYEGSEEILVEYAHISNSNAYPAAGTWYGGYGCTNGGGNVGWHFGASEPQRIEIVNPDEFYSGDIYNMGTITIVYSLLLIVALILSWIFRSVIFNLATIVLIIYGISQAQNVSETSSVWIIAFLGLLVVFQIYQIFWRVKRV